MAELVKQEVRKTVETQKHVMLEIKKMIEAELDRAHELLLGALARIRNTVRKKRHYVGIFPILGGGLTQTHFFLSVCQVFFACQNHPEVLKHVLQKWEIDI